MLIGLRAKDVIPIDAFAKKSGYLLAEAGAARSLLGSRL